MSAAAAINSNRCDLTPRMRRSGPAAAALVVLCALGCGAMPIASASVVYDNTASYSSVGLYYAQYANVSCQPGDCFSTAQDFGVDANYTLTSIGMPLSVFSGSPNKVRITLYGSSSGLPGAIIESWLVEGQMPNDGFHATNLLTVTSVLNPVLSQGGQYFVGFDVPELTSFLVYLRASNLVETRTIAQTFDHGATWDTRYSGTTSGFMAFRVDGERVPQVVPIPGTLALTALALGLMLRASRQVR